MIGTITMVADFPWCVPVDAMNLYQKLAKSGAAKGVQGLKLFFYLWSKNDLSGLEINLAWWPVMMSSQVVYFFSDIFNFWPVKELCTYQCLAPGWGGRQPTGIWHHCGLPGSGLWKLPSPRVGNLTWSPSWKMSRGLGTNGSWGPLIPSGDWGEHETRPRCDASPSTRWQNER